MSALQIFPQRMLQSFRPFSADNKAYTYHVYKQKCLDTQGLICDKKTAHSHERETVSDFPNPIKPIIRLAARATRIALETLV